ncbi:MAG: hypothetical protein K1000chlam2_00035 [Chlamydiae bacterium]|nr:hypothetical protein [Chlamydiota bacterium]
MECQTCKGIVQVNNTGICLGCQRGFVGIPQEDTYNATSDEESKKQNLSTIHQSQSLKSLLKEKEKEIENADEVASTASVDACQQTKYGQEVGKRNSKGRKASKKG